MNVEFERKYLAELYAKGKLMIKNIAFNRK